MPLQKKCSHSTLRTTPSQHAEAVGYKQHSTQQLFTAATGSRKKAPEDIAKVLEAHPFPSVLPDDELAYDPTYPPQSLATWTKDQASHHFSQDRNVVYVTGPPTLDQTLKSVMKGWDKPDPECYKPASLTSKPAFDDILAYLTAFFYGLTIRKLPDSFEYTSWEYPEPHSKKARLRNSVASGQSIGLSSSRTNEMTRIRVRQLDSEERKSPYSYQLNLNDILDHAIAVLPPNAHALLLLVNHDLYEDDDDDFCIGRAYGGSRVAVVSMAQYQPALDAWHGVDAQSGHIWPVSHCEKYIQSICELVELHKKKRKVKNPEPSFTKIKKACKLTDDPNESAGSSPRTDDVSTPLETAAAVRSDISRIARNPLPDGELSSLYLRRVALTASHELLHCFGLDHCVYFACAMQGTASVAEDSRQPPYLCPVCENKLANATFRINQPEDLEAEWWKSEIFSQHKIDRMRALIEFYRLQLVRAYTLRVMSPMLWYKRLLEMQGEHVEIA